MSCEEATVALFQYHSALDPTMINAAYEAFMHCVECNACWLHYCETFCTTVRNHPENGLRKQHLTFCIYCQIYLDAVP